jgi:hypothetical protein
MVLREGGLERAGHQIGGEIMPLNLVLSHTAVYLVSRRDHFDFMVIPDIRQACSMLLGRFRDSPIPYRILFWKVVQACIKRGLHMRIPICSHSYEEILPLEELTFLHSQESGHRTKKCPF